MTSQPQTPPSDAAPESRPVVSFVVRFVYDSAEADGPAPGADGQRPAQWHGFIRHVQSDAERYFTHWDAAVAFIEQFVHITDGE
jgi:hypothetical protein